MTVTFPETTAHLRQLVKEAQALIDTIAEQNARDARAFDEGYRLGFGSGVEVGYGRAQHDEELRSRAQAEAIKQTSRTWTVEELKDLGQPGGFQKLRYPHYTAEQLLKLRGRDRFPMADRLCVHCDGRGYIAGGVA